MNAKSRKAALARALALPTVAPTVALEAPALPTGLLTGGQRLPDSAFAALVADTLSYGAKPIPAPADTLGYPLPSYGLSIWLTGDRINIAIPGAGSAGTPHTISIPLAKCSLECGDGGTVLGRQRGWLILLELLKSKEREKRNPNARIGEASAPVRNDIEKLLVASKIQRYDSKSNLIIDYADLDFGDES